MKEFKNLILAENENYLLTKPYENFDMNYHLLEKTETTKKLIKHGFKGLVIAPYNLSTYAKTEYLIDIEDVTREEYQEMLKLEDIDFIKELAWKII